MGRNLGLPPLPARRLLHRGNLTLQTRSFETAMYSTGGISACHMPYEKHLGVLVEGGCGLTVDRDAATGRAKLVTRPLNLMVGLALQTLKHLSGDRHETGVEVMICRRCEKTFEAGTGTGRRTRAMYCSARCGNAHRHARRQSKAKLPG